MIDFFPLPMQEFLGFVLFGNTILTYLSALGVFALSILCWITVQYTVRTWFRARALKTATILDDLAITVVASFKPPFYIYFSFFLGLQVVYKPKAVETIALVILLLWLTYECLSMVQEVITEVSMRFGDKKRNVKAAVALLSIFLTIIIWLVGGSIILANLGIDPTALIAGLGIGGIFLAFAVQNIVGDLFQYFAIRMDNPVTEGDFIAVGDLSGKVVKIGIRTTRLVALTGEEIVIHNKDLTSSRVQNYGKSERRGGLLTLYLSLQTPAAKIEALLPLIEDIVQKQDKTVFERCNYVNIAQTGFVIETYFRVHDHSYENFLNVKQRILLDILRVAEKKGYVFASTGINLDSFAN